MENETFEHTKFEMKKIRTNRRIHKHKYWRYLMIYGGATKEKEREQEWDALLTNYISTMNINRYLFLNEY